ncbi:MAG TPA: S8 family serine peptidase [Edaphocola sp.]|nr:S8 family serine peptidase [Edaphocola sp.]
MNRKLSMRLGICLSISLALSLNNNSLQAQQVLQLRNRAVNLQPITAIASLSNANSVHRQQVYLRFSHVPDRAALQAQGIRLLEYVGDMTFTAVVNTGQLNAVMSNCNAWAPVLHTDKLSNYLLELHSDSYTQVLISLAPGADKQVLIDKGYQLAAEQPWALQNKWIAQIAVADLNPLAALPEVLNISPKFEDQALNSQAIALTNATTPKAASGLGLTGEGIVVGVGDDSYASHIDLADRATNLNPLNASQHGQHTSGTVAGAGIINELNAGFAPKASLVTNYFSNIIAYAYQYESNFNMKLTNNSYAAFVGNCAYAGTYDATSQYLDAQALAQPHLLNIFAAGNDGRNTCGPFPTGYATVVGAYQAAKNPLVVGLTGKHSDHINEGTGRGPVKDGRLKPEIVAVGVQLASTSNNNNYAVTTGTSMACPNVTGAAALLQELYKSKNGGQYPPSALLKAVLMNSATDIGNPGPDYAHGFGLLNVAAASQVIDSAWYISGTLSHQGQQAHQINVPANLGQLKIMLYWHDAPASPSANKMLVNDLDMVVNTPSNQVKLPLVLNPEPNHVLDAASPGVDRLNNVEQVTINNPEPGTYTISVHGFSVPSGSQSYYITYTFIPNNIEISYPSKGARMIVDSPTIIHWKALEDAGDFTVEYSTDNGGNWQTISNNIPANKRYTIFTPPAGTASNQCLIRVSNNASSVVSAPFSIIGRPVATLSTNQCPGNIAIEWNAIPGSTQYYLYKKVGAAMQLIDSTTNTSYNFSGLHPDSTYWVAVAAALNSTPGIRSIAVSRKPNNGSCVGITNHGDLAIRNVTGPGSGRKLTSTELSGNQNLSVQIANNDNLVNSGFAVQYRINGGAWQSYTGTTNIPAAGQITVNIPGFNFSAVGEYHIDLVVTNTQISDPVSANDSFSVSLRQLPNEPLNLNIPWEEGFETLPVQELMQAQLGLGTATHFDFANDINKGRLRTKIMNELNLSGNRSISLDHSSTPYPAAQGGNANMLTGTFNLSNYDINTDEIRFEFDYRLHGKFTSAEANNNRVQVRGSDASPWISLPNYDTNTVGQIVKYGAISLRDVLLANGQQFSTSTQIRMLQDGNQQIGAENFGKGLTIDNVKLFKAENDIALVEALNTTKFNCGLTSAEPLTVRVANTMPHALSNIPINYQVNNGAIISETIPNINAKDTIIFTFNTLMDLSTPGKHEIMVWASYPGDNYPANDSLSGIIMYHQPLVSSFPYLEGFEDNDGYYFTDGINSSWEHGSPNGLSLTHAANGTKAWKTSLNSAYNANEQSYLYSPCFDLSTLANPMLSFSFFREIEAAGTEIYDSAFVEYSTDGGQTWLRLGAQGDGFNWYNSENNIWLGTSHNYWAVASIPLPAVPSIAFRWALFSDPGAQFGGLAIDDVHIFDYQKPIFDLDSFPTAPQANINAITEFGMAPSISAIVDPLNENLGNTTFQTYAHSSYISPDSYQYYLPRSFMLHAGQQVTASNIQLSLFVRDSLMNIVRNANNCASCATHPKEVYQLGVTTYVQANNQNINNDLSDNEGGDYSFIVPADVRWVPYYDGYYAVFETNQIGEYWFNDGGITGTTPLPNYTFDFDAEKIDKRSVRLSWSNGIDNMALDYELQADMGQGFKPIFYTSSVHNPNYKYQYIDTPSLEWAPNTFYRVKYSNRDGKVMYSPIRKISWDGLPFSFEVYPNPTHDGKLQLQWYNVGAEPFSWTLHSFDGRTIASGSVAQSQFSGSQLIDIAGHGVAGSIYLLRVQANGQTFDFKIVYQPE